MGTENRIFAFLSVLKSQVPINVSNASYYHVAAAWGSLSENILRYGKHLRRHSQEKNIRINVQEMWWGEWIGLIWVMKWHNCWFLPTRHWKIQFHERKTIFDRLSNHRILKNVSPILWFHSKIPCCLVRQSGLTSWRPWKIVHLDEREEEGLIEAALSL